MPRDRKEDKLAALMWILREFVKEGQPSIVFASTRHHVEFIYSVLQAAGLSVACVYGAMDQVIIYRQNLKALSASHLQLSISKCEKLRSTFSCILYFIYLTRVDMGHTDCPCITAQTMHMLAQ